MSSYLLSTSIFFQIVQISVEPHTPAAQWSVKVKDEASLWASTVSYGLFAYTVRGINDFKRRKAFERCLQRIPQIFDQRLIPVSDEIALTWAGLRSLEHRGTRISTDVALVLATAIRHDITYACDPNDCAFADEAGVDKLLVTDGI